MDLSEAQLAAVVAHTMPGVDLREVAPLGLRSYRLTLAGHSPVVLRCDGPADDWAGAPLAAEVAALTLLHSEFDLPLPALLHYAADGPPLGRPYALISYQDGTPLPEVIGELHEDQRYAVGRDLGALLTRVHSHSLAQYGTLAASGQATQVQALIPANEQADRDYIARRMTRALDEATVHGELTSAQQTLLRDWLAGGYATTGQPACLVHGDLRPERLLLQRQGREWRIGGLVGWGYAQGWRPGWDHTLLQGTFVDEAYFSLRVGYGNAYDEAIERRYDQVRELALLPYRLVLYLEAGRADLALALL